MPRWALRILGAEGAIYHRAYGQRPHGIDGRGRRWLVDPHKNRS